AVQAAQEGAARACPGGRTDAPSGLRKRRSCGLRLEEAVAAYRLALQERPRERVPLDWARTQINLGGALKRLGEREAGTARLEEAVAAYDAGLTVLASVLPDEQLRAMRNARGDAQAEIAHRRPN